VPVDEMTIRLVPLDLETLELLRADIMARVRVNANELADAIVARLKLAKAGDEADQDINTVGERTIALMIDKKQLLARANGWLRRLRQRVETLHLTANIWRLSEACGRSRSDGRSGSSVG
jgi:hypothetical protein